MYCMVNFFKNLVQKTSNLDNFCRKYFHWRNRSLGSNPSGVADQQRNGFHLSAVKLKLTTNQRLLQKNTLIYFTPTLSAAKKSSNKNVIYLALYQQLLYPSPFAFDFDEIFDQKKVRKIRLRNVLVSAGQTFRLSKSKHFLQIFSFMIDVFNPKRICHDCPFKSSHRLAKISILTPWCAV